ncbi:MAG: hypothetical protein WKF94_05270 [Solirubrobacteraceae bacterium]
MPALPLDEAGKYVAAAYLVFLALILIYVAIMAIRLATVQRDVAELAEALEARGQTDVAAQVKERSEGFAFSGDERSEAH